MFVRTKSHSLGRHWPHHRGRAALRYALVLALLALTLFTGPQPARAVATASSTPGTVVAWGSSIEDASTVPGNLSDVIAIAAGGYQNLALKSDGTVVAWGNNNSGQGNIPSGLATVTAIAAGNGHNLALKADGTVVAWGGNFYGQASVPAGLSGVTAIAAGIEHSLALVGSVAAPEIDVLGNGTSIVSGDSTPVTTDHTDFGSADVDGGTVVRTFTIENSGDAALTLSGSPLVAISGDHAAEFTVTALPSSPVAGGGITTFQITFDPDAAGARTATVTIANDDGDENSYTFAVQGTGFLPNVQFNGTACDLIDAINAANSDSASGTCPAGSGADTITLLSDITLSAINNTNNFGSNGLPQITSDITIEGDGHTLSRAAGASLFRFFDVDASGTLTLNRLTLHNGDALDANASIAGAIFNWGTVTVNNSTLSNNNGRSGGAIYNFGGTLTVNNSTFSGNTTSAFGDGGAISNSATMTVNNSTFSGNSSSKGGAINNSGTATVNSSTFSGNAATNQGGAIYNGGDNTLTLARSLLSGNSAADGAELYNEPAGFMPAGIVNSNNGNLFGQSGNAGTSGFTPTASDLVPSVGLSAILASLADNSGGTQTHALVAGSPAIDAAGDSGLATDQRGIARPQGCADDIGAFELDGVTCPSPEIDVQGNGVSIVSGDSTPAAADHTAFGSAEINSGTVVRTFTIHNSGDAALSAIAVRVEGYEPAAAHSGAVLPFSLTSAPATTVAAGQSTQFQITFAPSESGESSAVVIIESNDANEGYYVFVISGSGSARLLPNIQVATAAAATQSCAAGSAGYVRDCTVTFNLRNVGSDAMLVGHYRVNSVSAHAYVLNGEPTPGQAGTTVQAGELVNANGIFQPKFVIGLKSLTRYSINISVFGYAGVTAAGTDATDATTLIDQNQLAEIATFEVVLEPAEAAANFQFFLPIVQQ